MPHVLAYFDVYKENSQDQKTSRTCAFENGARWYHVARILSLGEGLNKYSKLLCKNLIQSNAAELPMGTLPMYVTDPTRTSPKMPPTQPLNVQHLFPDVYIITICLSHT